MSTHFNHHNSAVKPLRNKAAAFVKGFAAAAAFLVVMQAPAFAADPKKDPFARDTWHAVNSSWPGTLKFDGATKKVKLEPVGANPMEAKYTYTVKPSSAKDKAVTEGTLTMTNELGQVSESDYRIKGKELTLSFRNGQPVETYVRMSPAEEKAEIQKLEQLIREGRIKPLKPSKE